MNKTTVTLLALSLLTACMKMNDLPPSPPRPPQYHPDTTYSDYLYIQPHLTTFDTIPGNFIALVFFGKYGNNTYFPDISAIYGTASPWGLYKVRYLFNGDLKLKTIKVNEPYRVELEIANAKTSPYTRPFYQAYKEGTLENTVYTPSLTLAFDRAASDTSIPDLLAKINTLLKRNIDTVIFTRGDK